MAFIFSELLSSICFLIRSVISRKPSEFMIVMPCIFSKNISPNPALKKIRNGLTGFPFDNRLSGYSCFSLNLSNKDDILYVFCYEKLQKTTCSIACGSYDKLFIKSEYCLFNPALFPSDRDADLADIILG